MPILDPLAGQTMGFSCLFLSPGRHGPGNPDLGFAGTP
jgi:hypothetical protein